MEWGDWKKFDLVRWGFLEMGEERGGWIGCEG